MKRHYNIDKTISEKVFTKIGERGISQYRLSKDCNIPNSSISQIKKGKFNWRIEYLVSIAKYLNITIDELLYDKSDKIFQVGENVKDYYNVNANKIPIVGAVGCGEALKNWENYGEQFIELPETGHLRNPFIVIAKGDSMSPYINPNDKLLCSDAPELIKDKRAVIVCFKTEPETSEANAKLIKFLKNDMVVLYSVNTRYEPQFYYLNEIYKIYKVIRIIRDVK